MNIKVQLIALYTIVRREVTRIFRIWMQSLLGPIVNIFLYFLIFGNIVGKRIGEIHGVPYLEFIAPSLIMLTAINSSYANISSSFFLVRFQKNIEEMVVSPISDFIILLGFCISSVLRGILIALILNLVIYLFFNISIKPNLNIMIDIILATTLFSLVGFINGLKARTFDEIMIIPSFILTPLGYLGGVFFTIDMLPEKWQTVAKFNPLMYMIDTFRVHALNLKTTDVSTTYVITIGCILSLTLFILNQMKKKILLDR